MTDETHRRQGAAGDSDGDGPEVEPGLVQRTAAPVVEAAGRRAVATVVTPGVERVIALIGYRRVLIGGGLAAVTIVAVLIISILAAASAVTSLPMRLADALIGGDDGRPAAAAVSGASESLSPKELQYLVSQCASNTAEASTTSAGARTTTPAARTTTSRAGQSAAASSSATATPVVLGRNGQVPSKIAKDMSEQVPNKTDAVTANTWFLYRLSGAGETWRGFEQHLQTSGVKVTAQASAEQLLRQILPSDINVTVTRQQRTAAAALTLDGIRRQRIIEPSKGELQKLATQIVEACTGYNSASASPSRR